MKKVGIFGGSYNPIHIGHLALANYLCEFGDLDEIWFMVSPQNPFKAHSSDLWDDNLRLELVRLAVEDYPKLQASDFEFHLPRPSYTIHTLNALQEAYPDHEFTSSSVQTTGCLSPVGELRTKSLPATIYWCILDRDMT